MGSGDSWVTLLTHRAAAEGDRLACRFLPDGHAAGETTLTYRELDTRARTIAAAIHARSGSPVGSPILILCPPGLDFIAALFGVMCAGGVAVPAHPPAASARRRGRNERLDGIVRDCRPAVALTIASLRETVEQSLRDLPQPVTILCVDDNSIDAAAARDFRPPPVASHHLACIQYTSGSTSAPRGVELTHANLLHNSATIAECFGHSRDRSSGVIWLPPQHDMGLIGGVLQPLFVGFPVTLMPPTAFLADPLRWLRAVSNYRATTSGGPNFSYDLAADAIERAKPDQLQGLDLNCWEVAFNGAEPIDPATMERFARAAEPYGFRRAAFYPCYGLAEATLLVTGGDKLAGPRVHEFEHRNVVSCGRPRSDHGVTIVDPATGGSCAADKVGEICVTGGGVARGYYDRADESEKIFRPHLRTGDVGFLNADGELFVTGRLKDVIIIRGVNHYPHDIERSVARSHAALRPHGGAAVTTNVGGVESVAIVHELEREHRNHPPQPILDAVRENVAREHGLRVSRIVLLRPGALPVTPSGKVRRGACRDALAGNGFDADVVIAEWRADETPHQAPTNGDAIPAGDPAAIRAWLVDRLATELKVAPSTIDPAEPFARYGLDSAAAVGLSCAIGHALKVDVDATLFWDYPTVADLARHIAEKQSAATTTTTTTT
jgi:acyl-CoA synthetase (AMP-forming)/AMP-acid ligase II/acyl carrier protein